MTGSNLAASSQTVSNSLGTIILDRNGREVKEDTLCFPISIVRERLTQARLYKYTDSLLKISEGQVAELKIQRDLCTDEQTELKNNYDRQIGNLNQQISIYIAQVKGFETLLKKERRRRRLTAAGGILTTAAAITLMVLKK